MRTTDPGLLNQVYLGYMSGGTKVKSQQYSGVFLGNVVANSETNTNLSEQYVQFSIPSINANSGWPAAMFSGRGVPPVGTPCAIVFEGLFADTPRVLCFFDWQPSPVIFYTDTEPELSELEPGDIWIAP